MTLRSRQPQCLTTTTPERLILEAPAPMSSYAANRHHDALNIHDAEQQQNRDPVWRPRPRPRRAAEPPRRCVLTVFCSEPTTVTSTWTCPPPSHRRRAAHDDAAPEPPATSSFALLRPLQPRRHPVLHRPHPPQRHAWIPPLSATSSPPSTATPSTFMPCHSRHLRPTPGSPHIDTRACFRLDDEHSTTSNDRDPKPANCKVETPLNPSPH